MKSHTSGATLCWLLAEIEATSVGRTIVEPAHVAIALIKFAELRSEYLRQILPQPTDPDVGDEVSELRAIFDRAEIGTSSVKRHLRSQLEVLSSLERQIHCTRSPATRRLYRIAESIAVECGLEVVNASCLLAAILSGPVPKQLTLDEVLDVGRLSDEVRRSLSAPRKNQPRTDEVLSDCANALDRFGRDMTLLARQGRLQPVIGRREEIKAIARQLLHTTKPNCVLVGDPGVGKTQIVEGLAQRLVEKPTAGLDRCRLIEVFMSGLVAGTEYRGQFEKRLRQLLEEAVASDVVLFIDEIHTLLGTGGRGSSDAANILKPYLARGQLRVIGATTTREYDRQFAMDAALSRRFHVIRVGAPSRDDSIEILMARSRELEQHYRVSLEADTFAACYDLASRYLQGEMPDKALDLLEQVCASNLVRTLSGPIRAESQNVGQKDIAAYLSKQLRIPVDQLSGENRERLERLESLLSRRVIGQSEAIQHVSGALRTALAGLRHAQRPCGSFLFVGSTGTGKTELAKAIAAALYPGSEGLLRLDMSEYSDKAAKNRLLGAPPGYIGHDEANQLVDPMRANPHRVVLFDEIEKAHPEVLDVLLQILDEGSLKGTRGGEASFREAVVVLTSNLGAQPALNGPRALGFSRRVSPDAARPIDREEFRERIDREVKSHLRPELLNRLQEVAYFYPLGPDDVRRIVDKCVIQLHEAYLDELNIRVRLDESAYKVLQDLGYSQEYGAREVERIVARLIKQPLADALLSGNAQRGAALLAVGRESTVELVAEDE